MASSPKPRHSRPSRRHAASPPVAQAPEPEPPADDFGSEPAQTIDDAAEPAPIEHDARRSRRWRTSTMYRPPKRRRWCRRCGHVQPGETSARRASTPRTSKASPPAASGCAARRETKRRSSRWTAIILVLVAFNVALIGARNEVVRYLPQTASLFAAIGLPVNLRNLKFENVKISKESENGVTTLIVDGTIVCTGNTLDRSAAPAFLRAQRRRPGNLHLDRAALAQHSRAGREARIPQPARLAAGRRRRRAGALLQRPGRRRRHGKK